MEQIEVEITPITAVQHYLLNIEYEPICQEAGKGITVNIKKEVNLNKEEDNIVIKNEDESVNKKEDNIMTSASKETIERPFPCKECHKSFKLKHHLTQHLRLHTGERPFECKSCGKAFAHNHTLTTHVRLRHSDHKTNRPFKCHQCDKSFKIKQQLAKHIELHKKRPNLCGKCGLAFNLKKDLKKHMQLHGRRATYVCDLCGDKYYTYNNLSAHRAEAHPRAEPASLLKVILKGGNIIDICDDCGVALKSKRGKRLHDRRCPGKLQIEVITELLDKQNTLQNSGLHEGTSNSSTSASESPVDADLGVCVKKEPLEYE